MIKRQKDYIKSVNALSLNSIMKEIYKIESNDKKPIEPTPKSILELLNTPSIKV
jgi:hypothetical protein